MADKKIIPWLDTVRVFASFAVIVGHFVSCFDGMDGFDRMRLFFFHAGNVGVFLFFALSGYLIPASLERSKSLWEFYRKKLIRVVIPFTVSYIVFGAALLALAPIDISIAAWSPFYHACLQSGVPWGILIAMFPVDVNIVKLLDLPLTWFVGEWFMGVLILLYAVAPILNVLIKRAPLITFVVSIAISVGTFEAAEAAWTTAGKVMTGWWLFPARIPEFLFGMILFMYKDFFVQHKRRILFAVGLWSVGVGAYTIVDFANIPAFLTRLYPLEPRSMLMSIPSTYLFFMFTDWLNENLPRATAWFNSFSDVSYMAMLVQHVLLYIFTTKIPIEDFHSIGPVLLFILVTVIIVQVSEAIKKFSDPVESYFAKRG